MTLLHNEGIRQHAIYPSNRKELHSATEMEKFLKVERRRKKEITVLAKKCILLGKVALLRGTEGAHPVDYLIIADQVIQG